MFKKFFLLFLTATIILSACGTMEVTIKQIPTPAAPAIDPTKVALEGEATAMRNFLTQQAATLWPPTPLPPPPPTFIPAQKLPILSPENAAQITLLTRLEGTAIQVAWSPDGKLLAIGSTSGIYLYDSKTMKQQRLIDAVRDIKGMAFSPDGHVLVSASFSLAMPQLWDVGTGQLLRTLGKQEQRAANVAFNPNERMLPLEGGSNGNLTSVAFSPDGRTVATGSTYGVVTLWDAVNGQAIRNMNPLIDPATGTALREAYTSDFVPSMVFSPDGHILASGGNGGIKLWAPDSGQLLSTLEAQRGASSIAFSSDGHTLASAGIGDGAVRLSDVGSGQLLRTLQGEWATIVTFSPNGRMIASGGKATLELWDTASDQLLHTLGEQWAQWVSSIAFSPDGRMIAVGTKDGTLIYGILPH